MGTKTFNRTEDHEGFGTPNLGGSVSKFGQHSALKLISRRRVAFVCEEEAPRSRVVGGGELVFLYCAGTYQGSQEGPLLD